ncbi:MAG: aromatic ring-hydroxylating dioxygenase subunit alpha [Rivularia sp. (in: Bacteria)]|nr:aromatic ring-hydroxylating dioxygenase subunit alpha [Rivularia sp. MS3]
MKSRFPFTSFPNGWFCIAYSHELLPGDVKPIHYFGQDLVLFRTESGTPYVLNAHCPHLGAHLGYGGCVQGETIQCPFHGWRFNEDGKCIEVPYANKIPAKAQARTWCIRELNGVILVYYHAQGKPPTWEPPQIPELNSQEWTKFKEVDRWRINSHLQDLHEQVVDIAHFPTVHSDHSAKSQGSDVDGPVWKQRLYSGQAFKAATLDFKIETQYEIALYGLGYSLQRYCINGIGKLQFILLFLTTPVNEKCVEIQLLISVKKLFNKAIASVITSLVLKMLKQEMEKDITILENKLYRKVPLLCDGDGEIIRYRHWASQFYSENLELLPSLQKIT